MASGAADSPDGLRIEVLGPVEASVGGRAVALGGRRSRALFAALALASGRVVSTPHLIDALWGDDPPARARDGLQMHVSRLRKALTDAGADGGRLVNRAGGYAFEVAEGGLDVDRWHAALARARRARDTGDLAAARAAIEDALRLWRGPPLAGVFASDVLAAERAALDEERLRAVIDGIELDLELGRHGEVLGQLDALAIAHPLNERLVELQMLALYRSGRQPDALAAFRAARSRFVEELGIEPSEKLRELHDDVLGHAPGLSPAVRHAPQPAPTVDAAPPARSKGPGLPVPPNRTIGREPELAAIAARLCADDVRLVTLTGPGGVGKTRLAVEAARAVQADYADGGHFISLAAVGSAEKIPTALVEALGIAVLSGESPEQATQRFVAGKRMLLLVDNFEHVLAGAEFVAQLLAASPALTVLATSREPLAVHAEKRHPVEPLALPEAGAPVDAGVVAEVAAVALFCERARAHDPGFRLDESNAATVASICQRVDGLPLGIELAAARCGLLTASEVAERLDEALAAPGAGARDAAARQQTLRATVEWSYDLLSDEDKACFARLAVFAGGAAVEAAESIAGARLDNLDGLVAKSLLVRRRQADAPTRLHMLEPIRAYAAECLEAAPDADTIRSRHYDWFHAFAHRHGNPRALFGAGRPLHVARLDADIENLNAALAWAARRPDAQAALRLCDALGSYWWVTGRYAEAVSWTERALSMPGAEADPALRVRVLCDRTHGLWPLWRRDEVMSCAAEAEAIARALGDPLVLSHALQTRARLEATDGTTGVVGARTAAEALELATASGDDWAIATAAYATAIAAPSLAELRTCVERAASLLDEVGNTYFLMRMLAAVAPSALCLPGGEPDAREYAARAAALAQPTDDLQSRLFVVGNSACVALFTGDLVGAADGFRQSLEISRELAAPRFAIDGVHGFACIAAVHGETDRAARLAGAATTLRGGAPLDELEMRIDAEFMAPARARLGGDAWDAAARDGEALSLEDAIAYALEP